MYERRWAVAVATGAMFCAGPASADLLGINLDFPLTAYDNLGTTSYDAGSNLFTVDAEPLSIRFDPMDPPRPVVFSDGGERFLEIRIEVDESGALVGGVPGDDLIMVGAVDEDGNGTIDYDGVLLTGEVQAFGFQDGPLAAHWNGGGTDHMNGDLQPRTSESRSDRDATMLSPFFGGTDEFEFRFVVTGGLLAGFYVDSAAGVSLTSEASTFEDDFTENFGGGAKGFVAVTEAFGACCLPTGECVESLKSECEAAGGDFRGSGSKCEPGTCEPPGEGACCLPGGGCDITTADTCDELGGEYQGDGTMCTPNALGEPGSYRLKNHPDGNAATPFYGIRLDELFDVTGETDVFTFDFEAPGAAMFLDYDGTSIRIHGTAFGGLDIGDDYDPDWVSMVEIDFTYAVVTSAPGDDDLVGPEEDGTNSGSITWLETGEVIPLFDKAGSNPYTFFFGDEEDDQGHRGFDGLSGWGWFMYEDGMRGGTADWLFTACPICPPAPGACCLGADECVVVSGEECDAMGGTYLGDGTLCTPDVLGDPGSYWLLDHPAGGPNPPPYGIRFDELFDVTGDNDVFTFSFEAPGTHMVMDYDGTRIRIHGRAFGGLDIGEGYDPDWVSFIDVDMTYDTSQSVPGDDDIEVKEGDNNVGTLVWVETGMAFPLIEEANAEGTTFRFGNEDDDLGHRGFDGLSGWGWWATSGLTADWLFTAHDICPDDGACCLPNTDCSTGNFECQDKIEFMTMIWDGTGAVDVIAYDGNTGDPILGEFFNVQPGDEITVGPLMGPNDSIWEIFEAGTGNLIGESKFHRSCSDNEMNGPEDCGNRQGNGKGNDDGFINDWILEGLVDGRGNSFDCGFSGGGDDCQVLTPADCEAAGGVFVGGACEDADCTPPMGACCFENDCVNTTQFCCESQGGLYQGDGTDCATTKCFDCDGKIVQMTMIWDGAGAVDVIAYDGDTGDPVLGEFNNVQPGDQVTVGPLTGPNDSIWEIFDANTGELLGESKFHRSCSDNEMNGPEDCGNRQGNGKGNDDGFINDWILEGLVDEAGAILDCSGDGNPLVISVRIRSSLGDAEERMSDGYCHVDSSDLELAVDGTTTDLAGMRFETLSIPSGSMVESAYVQFTVDEVDTGSASLVIRAEAADDAAPFADIPFGLSSRPMTTSSVDWAPAAWDTVGEAGIDQRTSDLSVILQEVVSREGWTAGGSIVLMFDGSGTRTAEAYDGDSGKAPLLVVTYSLPSIGEARTGDVNDDGTIDSQDLLAIMAAWGSCPATCRADVDGNLVVDDRDMMVVLSTID